MTEQPRVSPSNAPPPASNDASPSRRPPSSATARWIAAVLFLVVLLCSRGCKLGDKPLAHDESLFGYYSYCLAVTGVYEYDPILHGPLLLELTAGVFLVFGDSDLTLRFVPLFCGLLLFPLLLALRPWLGRRGLQAALLLFLLSPNICYYSRFLRNDMLFMMLTLLNLVAIAYALKRDSAWPLVLWPVSLALMVSTKENVVFIAASQIGFALLWIALDDRHIVERDRSEFDFPAPAPNIVYFLKLTNISLLLWCAVAWLYVFHLRGRLPLGYWILPLWLIGVVTTAVFLDAMLRAARDNPGRIGLVFRLYERFYCDRYWWIAGFGFATATVYFCYSICLLHPRPILLPIGWGMGEGAGAVAPLPLLGQAVAYWWGEHASERLGGPFHCYTPQMFLYEFPAMAIILGSLVRDWWRKGRTRLFEVLLWLVVGSYLWTLSFWYYDEPVLFHDMLCRTPYDLLTARLQGPWSYLHLRSTGELFWAAGVVYWGGIWTVRSIRAGRLVRAWFIFWAATSYLFYGYAGEKVPWLALHIILPSLLLAAVLWGEWAGACKDARRRRFVTALAFALLAWNGWQTYLVCIVHPTNPAEIAVYNHTLYSAKTTAKTIDDWIDKGYVSGPSAVVIQGEAAWPFTWYFRNSRAVRFEQEDYVPSWTDEVVVTDPGTEERVAMLRHDFGWEVFDLRTAWVAPTFNAGELLCLRPLPDEPRERAERSRYRRCHRARILKTLGNYILFRRAYGQMPPPEDDVAFGVVTSVLWVRERATPEPLQTPAPILPPLEPLIPPPD